MTLASRLAAYIQRLTVTQGRYAGQPVKLLAWQKKFLRGAFRPGVQDAALSLGRSNGKSTLMAALGAACVDEGGPLVSRMADNVVIASSFSQSKIVFDHIVAFMQPTFARYGVGPGHRYRKQDTQNAATILDTSNGAKIRCIGSDPARAHGLAFRLAICDELSEWPDGSIDRMLAAILTARGKIEGSQVFFIGTRASDPTHPFEKLLTPGTGSDYVQCHAAARDASPSSVRTWRTANPSMDYLPDLKTIIRKEAARAKVDAELMAQFRARRLNQGVSDTRERFMLDPHTWAQIEKADVDRVGPHYMAVDAGSNASMSCVSSYWPTTGALACIGLFPENPSLSERGHVDGVSDLYVKAFERHELFLAGDQVADLQQLMRIAWDAWGKPVKVICDTWREKELRQVLSAIGFPPTSIETRRQGWKDGSEDLRIFRNACWMGRYTPSHRSCCGVRLEKLGRRLIPVAMRRLRNSAAAGEGTPVTMRLSLPCSPSRLAGE